MLFFSFISLYIAYYIPHVFSLVFLILEQEMMPVFLPLQSKRPQGHYLLDNQGINSVLE
jgi:hypothetical protein